jgi:hypothetical protein
MPDHKLLSLAAALRARVEEVLLRPSLCKTLTLGRRCAASLRPTKNWCSGSNNTLRSSGTRTLRPRQGVGRGAGSYAADHHSMVIWSGSILSRSTPSLFDRLASSIFAAAGSSGDRIANWCGTIRWVAPSSYSPLGALSLPSGFVTRTSLIPAIASPPCRSISLSQAGQRSIAALAIFLESRYAHCLHGRDGTGAGGGNQVRPTRRYRP